MRVLHLSSEYPPQKVFGLGRFVHDLALAQARQGDEVTVVTNSLGGEEHDAVKDGVHVCRISFPPPPKPPLSETQVLQFNVSAVARAMQAKPRMNKRNIRARRRLVSGPAPRNSFQTKTPQIAPTMVAPWPRA